MIGLSLTFFAYIAAVAASRSLEVKVSVPKAVSDVDHLSVLTMITNTGDETLKLLNDPRSTLSLLATDKFTVMNSDGASPVFNGIHVAYLPHHVARRSRNESFFKVLGPGEFVEASHEVFRYYNFTHSGPGSYTFTPDNTFYVLEGDGSVSTLEAVTIPAAVDISGKLSSSKSLGLHTAEDMSPIANRRLQKRGFISCEQTQTIILAAAATNADTACSRAVGHLQNNPTGSSLESTWFGTWTQERHNKVLMAYHRLAGTFSGWTYECKTCQDSRMLAYVHADKYGMLYICPGFWDPKIDMNERVVTTIHEGVHWPGILGAGDYAYNQKNSQDLARTNPAKAIYNADNYGYFAINA